MRLHLFNSTTWLNNACKCSGRFFAPPGIMVPKNVALITAQSTQNLYKHPKLKQNAEWTLPLSQFLLSNEGGISPGTPLSLCILAPLALDLSLNHNSGPPPGWRSQQIRVARWHNNYHSSQKEREKVALV